MFVIQIISVCFPMQFNLELWRHQNNLCNAVAWCFFYWIIIWRFIKLLSLIRLFICFCSLWNLDVIAIKHIKKWSRQHVEKPQLKITNKKRFWKAGILVKENVILILSFPTCKDDNARLRILPLTFVSDQIWIKNISGFSVKVTCAFLLQEHI